MRLRTLPLFLSFFLYFLPSFSLPSEYSRFGIIGDTSIGENEKVFVSFVRYLEKEGIRYFFHTGDVIHTPGSESQWDRFLEIKGPFLQFHISPGNHDINSIPSLNMYRKKTKKPPFYSFETHDTLFILLCTELPGETGKVAGNQLNWLVQELKKEKKFKFIFLHRPLFSTVFGKSLPPGRYQNERDNLHGLFLRNGVSCVFSGHEHVYGRISKDGIIYVTTGGGGAKLLLNIEEYGGFHHYIVAKKKEYGYIFSVLDIKGRKRDEFTINR